MKQCSQCSKHLPLSEFHKSKSHKMGRVPACKSCISIKSRQYYARNSEKCKKKSQKFRDENPDANKKYYQENSAYFKKYREEKSEHYKQLRIKNRDRANRYRVEKRKNDPDFKIKCNLRSRLSGLIRKSNAQKCAKTMELLGCSIEKFRSHLEKQFQPGMSWGNYGEWHLDHIVPCAKFDLTNDDEQRKCFHYSNFQPLWAIDNFRKGDRV